MASIKTPNKWSAAVKGTVAGMMTVGGIIAMFLSVESWTEDKITVEITALEKRRIQQSARHEVWANISHDKIIQRQRMSEAQINIRLAEIDLAQLEDEIGQRREQGLEKTERQARAQARLIDTIKIWERQMDDAREKLVNVSEVDPRDRDMD